MKKIILILIILFSINAVIASEYTVPFTGNSEKRCLCDTQTAVCQYQKCTNYCNTWTTQESVCAKEYTYYSGAYQYTGVASCQCQFQGADCNKASDICITKGKDFIGCSGGKFYKCNGCVAAEQTTAENTKEQCNDGYDNDCDGKTDGLDIECAGLTDEKCTANEYVDYDNDKCYNKCPTGQTYNEERGYCEFTICPSGGTYSNGKCELTAACGILCGCTTGDTTQCVTGGRLTTGANYKLWNCAAVPPTTSTAAIPKIIKQKVSYAKEISTTCSTDSDCGTCKTCNSGTCESITCSYETGTCALTQGTANCCQTKAPYCEGEFTLEGTKCAKTALTCDGTISGNTCVTGNKLDSQCGGKDKTCDEIDNDCDGLDGEDSLCTTDCKTLNGLYHTQENIKIYREYQCKCGSCAPYREQEIPYWIVINTIGNDFSTKQINQIILKGVKIYSETQLYIFIYDTYQNRNLEAGKIYNKIIHAYEGDVTFDITPTIIKHILIGSTGNIKIDSIQGFDIENTQPKVLINNNELSQLSGTSYLNPEDDNIIKYIKTSTTAPNFKITIKTYNEQYYGNECYIAKLDSASETIKIVKDVDTGEGCKSDLYNAWKYCYEHEIKYDLGVFMTSNTYLPVKLTEDAYTGGLKYEGWPACGDDYLDKAEGETCETCPGDVNTITNKQGDNLNGLTISCNKAEDCMDAITQACKNSELQACKLAGQPYTNIGLEGDTHWECEGGNENSKDSKVKLGMCKLAYSGGQETICKTKLGGIIIPCKALGITACKQKYEKDNIQCKPTCTTAYEDGCIEIITPEAYTPNKAVKAAGNKTNKIPQCACNGASDGVYCCSQNTKAQVKNEEAYCCPEGNVIATSTNKNEQNKYCCPIDTPYWNGASCIRPPPICGLTENEWKCLITRRSFVGFSIIDREMGNIYYTGAWGLFPTELCRHAQKWCNNVGIICKSTDYSGLKITNEKMYCLTQHPELFEDGISEYVRCILEQINLIKEYRDGLAYNDLLFGANNPILTACESKMGK